MVGGRSYSSNLGHHRLCLVQNSSLPATIFSTPGPAVHHSRLILGLEAVSTNIDKGEEL